MGLMMKSVCVGRVVVGHLSSGDHQQPCGGGFQRKLRGSFHHEGHPERRPPGGGRRPGRPVAASLPRIYRRPFDHAGLNRIRSFRCNTVSLLQMRVGVKDQELQVRP